MIDGLSPGIKQELKAKCTLHGGDLDNTTCLRQDIDEYFQNELKYVYLADDTMISRTTGIRENLILIYSKCKHQAPLAKQ